MPGPIVHFNTVVCGGAVQHIEFGHPTLFVALNMLGPAGAVTCIAVHVPLARLRTWYNLERGAKALVRGEPITRMVQTLLWQ
jgi:hypothetical protein